VKKVRYAVSNVTDFPLIFSQLKAILEPYAQRMNLKHDTVDSYHLDGPYSERWGKELFFAAVQIKKNYVSFYLMPVYMFPDLLLEISPGLKKHMQGKSCFNFKKSEPDLFRELAELTRRGGERFRQEFPGEVP
jgi:hypothetical protein